MENDFVIRRSGGKWVAQPISDRGGDFARSDPRFARGRAEFDDAEVRSFNEEIACHLLFAHLPDGLPQANRGLVVRVLLLLLVILLPILVLLALV